MERLKDKVAIVTGASRGIGAGIARRFAAEGARVTLAARTQDRIEAVQAELGDEKALGVVTDVSVSEDLRRMVGATIERFGGLDILVNNAAIASFSRHLDADDLEGEYDRLMDTNVKSVIMGVHWALPHMTARGGGSVINIASVHGMASGDHMSAYAASKGALIAGTRAMAVELAQRKIRVNCISPGAIWLDDRANWIERRFGPEMAAEFHGKFGDWHTRMRELQQPLPVAGRPQDVAACAVYLASDEAGFCTGANFVVDGGMTAVLSDPAFLYPGAAETLNKRTEVRAWIQEARERMGAAETTERPDSRAPAPGPR
jgi:NAD(P)-dependent dehydrogenase (short-subunit alcohol dehydrogenase family)